MSPLNVKGLRGLSREIKASGGKMENHMDKQMAHEMETCCWCVYIYIYFRLLARRSWGTKERK